MATLQTDTDLWRWTIDGLVVQGVNVLSGGQTRDHRIVATSLANAMLTGSGALFDKSRSAPGDVLYVDPRAEFDEAVRILRCLEGPDTGSLRGYHLPMERSPRGLAPIDMWACKGPRPRLVVLDSWQALEPAAGQDAAAFDYLEHLCRRYAMAVLVLVDGWHRTWGELCLDRASMYLEMAEDTGDALRLRLDHAGSEPRGLRVQYSRELVTLLEQARQRR